jgi:branched-chain amino acid aminotransferase
MPAMTVLAKPLACGPFIDGDLSAGAAFVDGEIVPISEARIPLLDWGFLRSDACQDTVSVWKGSFFCLDRHIARFQRSLEGLRLQCPYDEVALARILASLVRRSGQSEAAYVQMLVTRGVPQQGSRDPRSCTNRFYAFCLPYVRIAPADGPELLDVAISQRPRIAAAAVPSDIKNYHWIDFELALFEAYDRGATSVVLSDAAGTLTEGPGFNLFCVNDGVVRTPASNVLPGITRGVVVELAEELGIDLRVGPVAADALRGADEAFATSTAGGVMPIRAVDGGALKETPGPITALIRDTYWRKREAGWHGTPVASL